ncbi:MAG: DUF1289 domain-containing protein [Terriglobales bacterium]
MGVCRAPNGTCVGCGRTLSEIAAWPRFDEGERQRLMRAELPRRMILLECSGSPTPPTKSR